MSREELMRRARGRHARRGVNLTAPQGTDPPTPLMSVFLDISTGAGLASSTGDPAVPPAAARRRAGARRHRRSTSTAPTSASSSRPRSSAVVVAIGVVAFFLERSAPPSPGRGAAERVAPASSASCSARCCSRGALADGGEAAGSGSSLGPLCAALGWLAVGGLVERVRAPARARPGGAAHRLRDAAALILAAIAIFVPPLALLAIPGFIVLLVGGRRRDGREVRRA